ncbi:hypothetical protein GpartN1_g2233.t1 [Galdieria partita]|uniref:Uncharacterized protein n=1 Tax=Galdieria partita TaxID=83374 RepID=A0A9C7PV11_9RHOD|nr:hypothetical protein GpartN1_g2233.t1 [Galdieria partita]
MQEDLTFSYSKRYSEGGKVARIIDNIEFRLKEDLPEPKRRRLDERGVKPVEEVTFAELKSYNRDQLRAYCYIYGIPRKKKAEMELDMARYASAFHPGDPNYDLATFESVESTHLTRSMPSSNNLFSNPFSRSSIYYQPGSTTWDGVSASQPFRPANTRLGGALGYPPSHHNNNFNLGRAQGTGLDSFRKATSFRRVAPSSRVAVKQRIEKNSTKNQREHARQTASKYRMALDGMGPLKVSVVANAASYFGSFDGISQMKIRDEAFERYERNNKLLLELFERPLHKSNVNVENDKSSQIERLKELIMTKESNFSEDYQVSLQEEHPSLNLKDLYKIDNIKTIEEFWEVKNELEKQYNVNFIHSPSKVKLVSIGNSKSTNLEEKITILQLR